MVHVARRSQTLLPVGEDVWTETHTSSTDRQSLYDWIARLVTVTIRPCLMTSVTTILGLAPIFLDSGRGSDVMQPMAIPGVGGMSVALVTLFVIPFLYCLVKEWQLRWQLRTVSPRTDCT